MPTHSYLLPTPLISLALVIMPMVIPSFAAPAADENKVLIGATTEVGSAEKEGIVGWKGAESVKSVLDSKFDLVQTTSYPAWDTWKGTGLESVTFDMSGPNQVIDFAKSKGKKVAVHLMAGSPTYFPAWFNEGKWTPAQLETLLDRWISHAATTNGNANKIDYWNVVNEVFMWNGSYWDSSTAANTNPWHSMGWEDDKSGLTGAAQVYAKHPVYIRKAFELARKYSPAKLELRDYGIEFWDNTKKTRAFYQLVKHLQNSGTPIDAIGMQGHFRTDFTYKWDLLKTMVSEYRKLGLEVYVTEVDYGDTDHIAAATTAHRTAAFDTAQSQQIRAMAAAAVAGGAQWICLWGVADNTNTYWRMGQSALLFDENYMPKPSFQAFLQGIADGMLIPNPITPPVNQKLNRFQFRNGLLHTDLASIEEVELRSVTGTLVARVPLQNGRGALPGVPMGLYTVAPKGDMTSAGIVVVW